MTKAWIGRKKRTFINHPDYRIRFRSKDEKFYYKILIKIFKEVYVNCRVREDYDFEIDFYIKDLNLFLDLHIHHRHNKCPFINSREQNEFKNSLEDNSKNRDLIYAWTIDDVKRLTEAKRLKLNYLAIYNDEQFYNWLKHDIIKFGKVR